MKKFVIILSALLFLRCEESENPVELIPEVEASADIYSLSVSEIQDPNSSYLNYDVKETVVGTAYFYQTDNVVTLEISLKNQTPNSLRAVHIHNGELTKPQRHWNQQSFLPFCYTRSLGQVWAKPFAGDIGNIPIDAEGNGHYIIKTDFWALNSGDEKDILDRVIIVHEDPEDFGQECDPAHDHNHIHNNLKIAGGKIELTSDVKRNSQAFKMTEFPDFTICN